MKSSMIQRQLKLNAYALQCMYDDLRAKRTSRKIYNKQADDWANSAISEEHTPDRLDYICQQENNTRAQANIYTPFINKLSKRIKALEQLQKALKRDLQEAYTIEHFEKTWEAMNDESFLMGRIRMAADDGFVEPGVVAEIVEAK